MYKTTNEHTEYSLILDLSKQRPVQITLTYLIIKRKVV